MATHSSLGIKGTFLTTLLVCTTSATHWNEHPQIDAVHAHNCDNDTYLVKGERVELDLGGKGFSSRLEVALTFDRGERGDRCRNLITPGIRPNVINQALGTLSLQPAHTNKIHVVGERVWFCIRETDLASDRTDRGKASGRGFKLSLVGEIEWVHQGPNPKLEMVQNLHRTKCSLSKQTKGSYPIHDEMGFIWIPTTSEHKLIEATRKSDNRLKVVVRVSANISGVELGGNTMVRHDRKVRSLNDTGNFEYKLITTGEPANGPEVHKTDGNIQIILGNLTNETNDATYKNSKSIGWLVPDSTFSTDLLTIRVEGLRVERHEKGLSYDEVTGILMADVLAEVRFFGTGFTRNTEILFTGVEDDFGTPCGSHSTQYFPLKSIGTVWAVADVTLPPMLPGQNRWYLCTRASPWQPTYHQGTSSWLSLKSHSEVLPVWLKAVFISILLLLAGLFSGLNLGLMALDKTELSLVSSTGTSQEKEHVRAIAPIRSHGNYLLCTLLLGNVLVNATLTILMDDLTSGLVAVICSTAGIVVFGEIVPQAICSRYGLAVGARSIWLVKIFMFITGPASYPISKILDFLLGEEFGVSYDRERLKELLKVTHQHTDIKPEEHSIICAALDFNKKTVQEIMRKMDDVYMLNIDVKLSFDTINEIIRKGYSRIPVYEGSRANLVSVLLAKDLACVHPDENTPLRTVCEIRRNPLNFVSADTTLDVMFRNFKEGSKGHMAFVVPERTNTEASSPAKVLGILTLNDVIKEILHGQIVHEPLKTDHYDFTEFLKEGTQRDTSSMCIHPQLQVAALQYLHASVDPFKEGQLSEDIVKKLIRDEALHCMEAASDENPVYLYKQGKPVDYFVLILEGRVEVNIGQEALTFESGPFTCFGADALSRMQVDGESSSAYRTIHSKTTKVQSVEPNTESFIPDYSVKVISKVSYLKIYCRQYMCARRAFLEEESKKTEILE